jgi:molecular chaperone Hsp33
MEYNTSPDQLLRLTLMDGQASVFLLRTTRLSQRAADIHQASDTAIAAMSRLMTGTLMLGIMLKGDKDSVTVQVNGGGPAGRMACVARGARVKVTMEHPQADLPPLEGNRPDVGGLVGSKGLLTVIKDTGSGEPYIGQCALVSGELGEDFTQYFTVSEQMPSMVALGCVCLNGQVLSAGGALITALPGCTEETLRALELRSMLFTGLSRELCERTLDEIATGWFTGLSPVILAQLEPLWRCDCSRERMERALISLGRGELNDMISDGRGAELTCHFCRAEHAFTTDDLTALLAMASRD